MGILNSVALGKSRKSAGNIRFSVWKGIPVFAQKPDTVANPRTQKQLNARSRITILVAVYRSIPALLDAMFQFRAIKQSAYNAFISANNVLPNLETNADGKALALPAENLVIANKDIVTATCSADVVGSAIEFTYTGLAASTSYSIIPAVGNTSGLYAENVTTSNFTTDSSGEYTISVGGLATLVATPNTAFSVIENQVTGQRFAFASGL